MTGTYLVTWTVDVEAESFEDAAAQALEMQRDPESTATFFMVEDSKQVVREIMLDEVWVAGPVLCFKCGFRHDAEMECRDDPPEKDEPYWPDEADR